MSILVDKSTKILVQGITGAQARVDTERCINYGTQIVAGVTPGRGGQTVQNVPVFDTVREALAFSQIDLSVIYAPPLHAKTAALETIEAGVKTLLITSEGVPRHDVSILLAAARGNGTKVIGCNSNGLISPGVAKVGGIGGESPNDIYTRGRVGICSRSGGMCAEIALELQKSGLGVSTCVSMGGDHIVGMPMTKYVELFQQDIDTDAIVLFGEPGTTNEQEVAEMFLSGRVRKPLVVLLAGAFQEAYPPGKSFGHAAAMINSDSDSVSAKRKTLERAGVAVARCLREVPLLLRPGPEAVGPHPTVTTAS